MKKTFLFSVIGVFVILTAMSSCKSHEKCPAYSKAKNTITTDKKWS